MQSKLSFELDEEINALSHDAAIGCLRAMIHGGWIDADVVRMAMRVQRRALGEQIAGDY